MTNPFITLCPNCGHHVVGYHRVNLTDGQVLGNPCPLTQELAAQAIAIQAALLEALQIGVHN